MNGSTKITKMKSILSVCLFLLLGCRHPSATLPAGGADSAAVNGSAPLAASTVAQAVRTHDTTTLAGVWHLQPVLASDTATGKTPEIRFDLIKSHFSGNTGCNAMNGEFWYSSNDSSLSFSDKFAVSRMICQGYNEQGFIKSLKSANHYRFEKGVLILMSDNTELSRWVRKQAILPKTGKA
jgi:heat shock protein HslJ